jgi:hypothetical protein
MTKLLSRISISWHAFIAAVLTALPILLQQLQVIDLKPLLSHYLGDDWAAVLVALMPFYIALLKPMISVEPHDAEEPAQ